MKIFNPTLKGDKIQYWESPEPNMHDYAPNTIGNYGYKNAKKEWLAAVKTLDVHPSALENIITALKEHLKAWPKGHFDNPNGISLSGIEDRLEIKKSSSCVFSECDREECHYFILKPLPSKEEEKCTHEIMSKGVCAACGLTAVHYEDNSVLIKTKNVDALKKKAAKIIQDNVYRHYMDIANDDLENLTWAIDKIFELFSGDLCTSNTQSEAVEFAKWVDENRMGLDYQMEHTHTIDELYTEFQNSKGIKQD